MNLLRQRAQFEEPFRSPMKSHRILSLLSAIASLGVSSAHAGQLVFSADFEGGTIPAGFSGAGAVTGTQGYSAFGFGSNFLRNDGTSLTVLTLTGLPAHTDVSVSFS